MGGAGDGAGGMGAVPAGAGGIPPGGGVGMGMGIPPDSMGMGGSFLGPGMQPPLGMATQPVAIPSYVQPTAGRQYFPDGYVDEFGQFVPYPKPPAGWQGGTQTINVVVNTGSGKGGSIKQGNGEKKEAGVEKGAAGGGEEKEAGEGEKEGAEQSTEEAAAASADQAVEAIQSLIGAQAYASLDDALDAWDSHCKKVGNNGPTSGGTDFMWRQSLAPWMTNGGMSSYADGNYSFDDDGDEEDDNEEESESEVDDSEEYFYDVYDTDDDLSAYSRAIRDADGSDDEEYGDDDDEEEEEDDQEEAGEDGVRIGAELDEYDADADSGLWRDLGPDEIVATALHSCHLMGAPLQPAVDALHQADSNGKCLREAARAYLLQVLRDRAAAALLHA